MSTQKQSLVDRILARISVGSVPVDGSYWFESRRPTQATARDAVQAPPRTPQGRTEQQRKIAWIRVQ